MKHLIAIAQKSSLLKDSFRYHPLYYNAAKSKIKRLQAADKDGRKRLQQSYSQALLKKARHTVYGRDMPEILDAWPLLTKEQVKIHPDVFITKGWLRTSACTGGSTGMPLKLRRCWQNVTYEQAFIDDLLAPYGFSFKHSKIAVLRGDTVKQPNETTPPYGVYRNNHYLILSFPHLNSRTLAWYVNELRRFRPDILWIYPTGGDLLASLCLAYDIKLTIPVVLSSSEMLFPEIWPRLQHTFNAQVIDYYGQAERVCFSYQTKPDEAWFAPAYGKVELIESEVPSPMADTKVADIVASGFWNTAMPLVRYMTGDRLLYPAEYTPTELDDVTLGLKPFIRILGRDNEYIVTPDGAKIFALNHLPCNVPHIMRLQIVQTALDQIEIRVQPQVGYCQESEKVILANARVKIPESVGITVRADEPLYRTNQHKTPFVVKLRNF